MAKDVERHFKQVGAHIDIRIGPIHIIFASPKRCSVVSGIACLLDHFARVSIEVPMMYWI